MKKFRGTYRVHSTRLQNWDYSWNGRYFITINTAYREYFFGHITNRIMQLTSIGDLAYKFWHEIPNHFPHVYLDEFVVMPNHIHGIVILDDPYDKSWNHPSQPSDEKSGRTQYNSTNTLSPKLTPGQKRFQNQGQNTVSSIIGSYKSVVTRNARKINPDFGWQPRFWDSIIRDIKSYQRIRRYIINNPKNWKTDRFFDD